MSLWRKLFGGSATADPPGTRYEIGSHSNSQTQWWVEKLPPGADPNDARNWIKCTPMLSWVDAHAWLAEKEGGPPMRYAQAAINVGTRD
jgi:hypothetical protein